jgi:hypothetical protein
MCPVTLSILQNLSADFTNSHTYQLKIDPTAKGYTAMD